MCPFLSLPPELFYQIALHLPLTTDVLALCLTHSRVHDALSTPALFQARLALQGWDMSAWKNKDDDATQPLIILKRCMRIDHIYCKTAQLFEESAQIDPVLYSLKDIDILEWVRGWPQLATVFDLEIARSNRVRVLDGEKTFSWLRKLSEVLPTFVTHHRGRNISRITEERHYNAFWAYTTFVHAVCSISTSIYQNRRPPVNPPEYDFFERLCFSLIALLIQCTETTVMTIFYDAWTEHRDPPLSLFQRAFWISDDGYFDGDEDASPALIEELVSLSVPERHFVAFFVQSVLCVKLHLEAAQSDTEPPLRAPFLPHIELSSCYDEPFELGTTSSLRPWLRDGLAGTPFAGLSMTRGTPWAGYYTFMELPDRDPPIFLELRSAEPPPNADPRYMYFLGEGHDAVGTFTIEGRCDTLLGTVDATKTYAEHSWDWRGVITPFGMVGTWGESAWSEGWWWIWPRAWSPTSTQRDRT